MPHSTHLAHAIALAEEAAGLLCATYGANHSESVAIGSAKSRISYALAEMRRVDARDAERYLNGDCAVCGDEAVVEYEGVSYCAGCWNESEARDQMDAERDAGSAGYYGASDREPQR